MSQIGQKFLKWIRKDNNCIEIREKNLKFFPAKTRPLLGLAMTLDKTPYLDPDIEEERQTKIRLLNDANFRVDKVQIGLFYQPSPGKNRNFSIEWEGSFMDKSLGWLFWEYDHKLIRVQIGNRMTEETGSSIVIKFSNIRKLGINYDFGNPCKCEVIAPGTKTSCNYCSSSML
jgi:RNA-dependent RNA polymerase